MKKEHRQVESRNQKFSRRPISSLWQEEASQTNPYLPSACRCHGYDLLELLEKRSFVDVLFLLFQGELPNSDQAALLERLMIALINPGPRHPAARGAMVAAASKTDPAHLLPIALTILGGSHLGAGEVEGAMLFLQGSCGEDPNEVVKTVLRRGGAPENGDWHPAPGFGCRFGGIDLLSNRIAAHLLAMPGAGDALAWGNSFASALEVHGLGWLPTGLAAAAFCDLGFHPRTGAGLYQLLSAPGLLAHGSEFIHKPMTEIPFPDDGEYVIEKD